MPTAFWRCMTATPGSCWGSSPGAPATPTSRSTSSPRRSWPRSSTATAAGPTQSRRRRRGCTRSPPTGSPRTTGAVRSSGGPPSVRGSADPRGPAATAGRPHARGHRGGRAGSEAAPAGGGLGAGRRAPDRLALAVAVALAVVAVGLVALHHRTAGHHANGPAGHGSQPSATPVGPPPPVVPGDINRAQKQVIADDPACAQTTNHGQTIDRGSPRAAPRPRTSGGCAGLTAAW
jgi:hypothetical protein